eukprot:5610133-Pleurochrysis_carterae.AAC.1
MLPTLPDMGIDLMLLYSFAKLGGRTSAQNMRIIAMGTNASYSPSLLAREKRTLAKAGRCACHRCIARPA